MTPLVHWEEGMLMRVQTMQMLQQGIVERLEGLRRTQQHYAYGAIAAEVASDALKKGDAHFVRLHVRLPSGVEVMVPEECRLQPLPLMRELALAPEVGVWLGVPKYSENAPNVQTSEQVDPRIRYRHVQRLRE